MKLPKIFMGESSYDSWCQQPLLYGKMLLISILLLFYDPNLNSNYECGCVVTSTVGTSVDSLEKSLQVWPSLNRQLLQVWLNLDHASSYVCGWVLISTVITSVMDGLDLDKCGQASTILTVPAGVAKWQSLEIAGPLNPPMLCKVRLCVETAD